MAKASPPWLQPIISRLLNPSKDTLVYFQSLVKNNDIVRLPLIRPNFLVNDPTAIHHVLLSNHANYTKAGTSYERIERSVGEGLLTASGEAWERRRHQFQPLFHYKHIKNYFDVIVKYAEQMLSGWARNKQGTINISEAMLSVVMNISSEALLGLDISSHSVEQVRMIHILNEYSVRSSTLWKWLPSLRNVRYQVAKKIMDNFILGSLKEQQRVTTEPLLGNLLAKDDTGKLILSEEEILSEVKNFFVAGHETTGNVLAWNLYSLVKNPYVLVRLQDEIQQVIGKDTPSLSQIEELTYLTMVLNESLRLYPPIWILTRKALAEDSLNEFQIPQGSIINICPYLIHRHPRYWHQPDIFYPERFHDSAGTRPKCAYIPFGFGPRVCIGRQLALLVLKVLTVMIVQRFELKLPRKNYHAEPLPLITLKAKHDISLYIQRKT